MTKKTAIKKGLKVSNLPEVVRQVKVVGGIFLEEAVAEAQAQFGSRFSARYNTQLSDLFLIVHTPKGEKRRALVQSRKSWDDAIKRLRRAIKKGENAELVLALEAEVNTSPLNTARFAILSDRDDNHVPSDLAYDIQMKMVDLFRDIDEVERIQRRVKRLNPEYRLGFRVEVDLSFEVIRYNPKGDEVVGHSTSSFLEALADAKQNLANARKRKK